MQISLEEVREAEGCKRAGYSAQIREYARLYNAILSEDSYLPLDEPQTWLEIQEVGDAVVAAAQADRMDRISE